MVEIVDQNDRVVWSRAIRVSSQDAALLRAMQLEDAYTTFERIPGQERLEL